jgi:hypothetical protein
MSSATNGNFMSMQGHMQKEKKTCRLTPPSCLAKMEIMYGRSRVSGLSTCFLEDIVLLGYACILFTLGCLLFTLRCLSFTLRCLLFIVSIFLCVSVDEYK